MRFRLKRIFDNIIDLVDLLHPNRRECFLDLNNIQYDDVLLRGLSIRLSLRKSRIFCFLVFEKLGDHVDLLLGFG